MISPYNIFGIVKEPIFPLITEISTLLLILSCRKKEYKTKLLKKQSGALNP